jgi:predicted RNase H-like HicB family nuclease
MVVAAVAALAAHARALGSGRGCTLGSEQGVMELRSISEPSEQVGFTARVPALPECISEGEIRDEVLVNIQEAIAPYLEPVDDGATAAGGGSGRTDLQDGPEV